MSRIFDSDIVNYPGRILSKDTSVRAVSTNEYTELLILNKNKNLIFNTCTELLILRKKCIISS